MQDDSNHGSSRSGDDEGDRKTSRSNTRREHRVRRQDQRNQPSVSPLPTSAQPIATPSTNDSGRSRTVRSARKTGFVSPASTSSQRRKLTGLPMVPSLNPPPSPAAQLKHPSSPRKARLISNKNNTVSPVRGKAGRRSYAQQHGAVAVGPRHSAHSKEASLLSPSNVSPCATIQRVSTNSAGLSPTYGSQQRSNNERQRQSYEALQQSIQAELDGHSVTDHSSPGAVRVRGIVGDEYEQSSPSSYHDDTVEVNLNDNPNGNPNGNPNDNGNDTTDVIYPGSDDSDGRFYSEPMAIHSGRSVGTRPGSASVLFPSSDRFTADSSKLSSSMEYSGDFSINTKKTDTAPVLESVLAIDDDVDFRRRAQQEAHAKVLATVTQAQIVTTDDKRSAEQYRSRKQKQKVILLVAIIATLAIIGGIVGYFVSAGGDDGGSDNKGSRGTTNVTQPTPAPTVIADVASPTAVPDNQANPNDSCETAITIASLSDLVMPGTTANARAVDETGNIPECPGLDLGNGRGVWYKMQSTAGQFLKASLCSNTTFDTQVSVFQGSSCDALTCLAANDQRLGCGVGDQSQVTWEMPTPVDDTTKTDIYVLVHGIRGVTGDYGLSLQSIDPADSSCVRPTPILSDDTPDGSIDVSIMTRSFAIGTIVGRPLVRDEVPSIPNCQDVDYTSVGAWHMFESASTGFLQAEITGDFDSRISIFRKQDAGVDACDDNLRCVLASDTGKVMFTVERGDRYYVLVHHRGRAPTRHDYTLTLSPGGVLRPEDPPIDHSGLQTGSNRKCDMSRFIPMQASNVSSLRMGKASGNTHFGSITPVPTCGGFEQFFSATSQGLWYRVEGDGKIITASTCGTEAKFGNFDTQMTVFFGTDCDDLSCVAANDQAACGDFSTVSWFALPRQQYLIYIHGVGTRTGIFNLTVEDEDIISENDCDDAISAQLGVSIVGTYANATIGAPNQCSNQINAPATKSVWYSVRGTGQEMIATTCDPIGELDSVAKIALFNNGDAIAIGTGGGNNTPDALLAGDPALQPNCDNIQCVNVVMEHHCESQQTILWKSDEGVDYRLQILGEAQNRREVFVLTVDNAPTNLRCDGAITESNPWLQASPIYGYSYIGGHDRGGFTANSQCDASLTGNSLGSWHKFKAPDGADAIMSASACFDQTSFDVKITVFAGDSCGNLQCVTANEGFTCGDGSSAIWQAEPNVEYHILVQGADPMATGPYSLRIGAENQICESLIPIDVDALEATTGSLQLGASPNMPGVSCFPVNLALSRSSVWYGVRGNGQYLRASTCHPETDFNARVTVYEGTCKKPTCVGMLDDDDKVCGEDKGSITWYAERGATYFILVHGDRSGNFGLSVDTVQNHDCASAIDARAIGARNAVPFEPADPVVGGSDVCGAVPPENLAAWFTVMGSGGNILVDDCQVSGDTNQIQTSIMEVDAIATGSDTACDALSCTNTANATKCIQHFPTVYGQEYKVLVNKQPDFPTWEESFVGISSPNGICSNAHGPIPVGMSVRGSTDNMRIDDAYGKCEDANSAVDGAWFMVRGTGKTITAFTCSPFTNIVAQIAILTGTCDDLQCVKGRVRNCGESAWASFETEVDQMYYIHVGAEEDTGDFVLTLS